MDWVWLHSSSFLMSDYGQRRCVMSDQREKSRFRWWEMFKRKRGKSESESVFAPLITFANCVFVCVIHSNKCVQRWVSKKRWCEELFNKCGMRRLELNSCWANSEQPKNNGRPLFSSQSHWLVEQKTFLRFTLVDAPIKPFCINFTKWRNIRFWIPQSSTQQQYFHSRRICFVGY